MNSNADIFRRTLGAEAERLAFPLAGGELDAMSLHYALLEQWNRRARLTAAVAPERAAVELFADCLVACRFADSARDRPDESRIRVIDIGAGTGLPGIAMKILRPGWQLTVVESNVNKISYLKTLVRELDIENTSVLRGRAETLGADGSCREGFDLAFCRAVGPPAVSCELAVPFLEIGGTFILQTILPKKQRFRDDRQAAAHKPGTVETVRAAAAILGATIGNKMRYSLTGVHRERMLIAVKKTASTPTEYPRSPRAIKKFPLA